MAKIKITARDPETLELFRSGFMFYYARTSDRMVIRADIENGKQVGRVSTLTIETERGADAAYFLNSRGEMISE